MILKMIMDIFFPLFRWLVDLIPDIELPIKIETYITPLSNGFGYIDTFVDLRVISLCVTAILIVDNWSRIVRIALKVWDMLPLT